MAKSNIPAHLRVRDFAERVGVSEKTIRPEDRLQIFD